MSIIKLDLPKYIITLPVTKKKVEIRPFTVKEEKILLLANEEKDIAQILISLGQVISNCTFGKEKIELLNKIDAEYLYVQIRNKSLGEAAAIKGICTSCKEKTPITLNYDEVKVTNVDKKLEPIQLMDNVWVTLRYPTLADTFDSVNLSSVDAIAYSLQTIIEGEDSKNALDYSIEDRREFVESMTSKQIELFTPFFENFPKMILEVDYTCKCGTANHIVIEGIENFFG